LAILLVALELDGAGIVEAAGCGDEGTSLTALAYDNKYPATFGWIWQQAETALGAMAHIDVDAIGVAWVGWVSRLTLAVDPGDGEVGDHGQISPVTTHRKVQPRGANSRAAFYISGGFGRYLEMIGVDDTLPSVIDLGCR
jgi:hypothetical protein